MLQFWLRSTHVAIMQTWTPPESKEADPYGSASLLPRLRNKKPPVKVALVGVCGCVVAGASI